MVEAEPIYSDSLIRITEEGILFKNYSLNGGDRFVPVEDIKKIVVKKPSVWNGQWKIVGGNIKTWFPEDADRPKRDVIFFAHIRNKWWKIGFTVEDSPTVVSILREKGLIDNTADTVLAETVELRNQSMINPSRSYIRGERLLIFIIVVVLLFSASITLIIALLD